MRASPMPTIFAQPVDGKSNERRATGGREGGPFRLAGLYRTSFMPTPSSVKSPAARNAARRPCSDPLRRRQPPLAGTGCLLSRICPKPARAGGRRHRCRLPPQQSGALHGGGRRGLAAAGWCLRLPLVERCAAPCLTLPAPRTRPTIIDLFSTPRHAPPLTTAPPLASAQARSACT